MILVVIMICLICKPKIRWNEKYETNKPITSGEIGIALSTFKNNKIRDVDDVGIEI